MAADRGERSPRAAARRDRTARVAGRADGAPRVAIVGGGMTGLGAARTLENLRAAGASVDWFLIEGEKRLGGKVQTVRRDGFVIEGGPDSALVEKPWPITMADELGIGDRLLDSNEDIRRSFVFADGRLHELPEGVVLMIPTRLAPFALSGLISWPGKLRMGLDLVLPRGPSLDDESLGDFVRRRLGREALAKIAEPIVAGIHAGDPEEMSVRATFPMFREMEAQHRSLILGMLARRKARARAQATSGAQARTGAQATTGVRAGGAQPAGTQALRAPGAADTPPARRPRTYFYSFQTGLADLSDAIVASLPTEKLRVGTAVTGIERRGPAGFTVALADGTREEVAAVVLATPAWASGALLRTVAPRAAAGLESIAYVSTATVCLAFPRDQVAHPLRGFGVVVPRAERRPLMAVTWSSSKFAGRAPEGAVLLRGFVGRAGAEEAAQLDDREMLAVVRRELADIMGIAAEPLVSEVFRWPLGMPQYRVGHTALVELIEREVAAVPGVEVAGGAFHGIGIGDCLREGAAAAERALAHVSGSPEQAVPGQPKDLPAGDGVED